MAVSAERFVALNENLQQVLVLNEASKGLFHFQRTGEVLEETRESLKEVSGLFGKALAGAEDTRTGEFKLSTLKDQGPFLALAEIAEEFLKEQPGWGSLEFFLQQMELFSGLCEELSEKGKTSCSPEEIEWAHRFLTSWSRKTLSATSQLVGVGF